MKRSIVNMSYSPFSPAAECARQKPSTWKDPKTGLEWQCESPGVMTWHEAQEYAESLSFAPPSASFGVICNEEGFCGDGCANRR
jgi:hypothetical protein